MKGDLLRVTLSFEGALADKHRVDMYDVSQALIGFQRSLALTTHLVLNQEIITQAPALKGAEIHALPPHEGSWKFNAIIVLSGAYAVTTLDNTSPLGHLVFSLYDYVVSESLGVHVDLNKSLGQLYEEAQRDRQELPEIKQHQADSLIEKCSTAIHEMHRPIFKSRTAEWAHLNATIGGAGIPLRTPLNLDTWAYIHETRTSEAPKLFVGNVSSYNSNTFKGRIYVEEFGRPVTFELSKDLRDQRVVELVTTSLQVNALRMYREGEGVLYFAAFLRTSRSGRLKGLLIVKLDDKPLRDV